MERNHGVLIGIQPTDYIAGATSPITYEVRKEDGNWESLLPAGELQWSPNANPQSLRDSMSCVSFSAINCIETQEKLLTGSAPNYSDRWIAKMSGTTKEGNYLYKVADTIRKYGLVLEEDYPTPDSFTWEEYHAEIPEPLLSQLKYKGQEWLENWHVSYEWVMDGSRPTGFTDLQHHLKHAPLQVIIPGHAIEEIYQTTSNWKYFDTYNPYIKTREGLPMYAMKILLTPKENQMNSFVKTMNYQGTIGVFVPVSKPEQVELLNSVFNVSIKPNPDGSIPTELTVRDA